MPVPGPHSERAPLLRVFGGLAVQVAALIRVRPTLAQRLVFAPPQAMHAVAAYLHLGVPAELSDIEVAGIIETHHPRDLMIKSFPAVPSALYRALGRSGDRACEPEVYQRAAALSTSSVAEAYLAGDPLNRSRLDHYEALAAADPLVAAMSHALPEDHTVVAAVNTVVGILRAHGALGHADLALPASAGRRAVLRRLLRLVDALQAPRLPFVVPAPYRLIESVGALRRAGMRFKNCIPSRWHGPSYWLGHARGEDLFITCDEPLFISRFCRVAPGTYAFSEMAGPSNDCVENGTRTALIAALRGAGANIIETDPAQSLTRLLDRLGARGGADDDGHPEVGFGDALDDLAA